MINGDIKIEQHILMSTISQFLRMCRDAARTTRPLTVVLGNEGGDLDSVVGSICLSFILNNNPNFDFGTTVPSLNFDPRDLPLRTDVHKFLQLHDVPYELLLTSDPTCKGSDSFIDLSKENINIVLFDHNLLTSSHKGCEEQVVGIVDHHKNENKYLNTTGALRIIKEIGSASTLVGRICQNQNIPFPFASFLAGPIVIDCENFDLSRNRATPEDIEVFQWLKKNIDPSIDFSSLYKQLKEWRANIFCLSVEENLRRDYKFYEGKKFQVGFSSIPCSRATFIKHYPSYANDALPFMRKRSIRVLFLTFAGTDNGEHQRDLVIMGNKEDIGDFIQLAAGNSVLFKKVTEETVEGVLSISYSITDTTMSRKKLVPMVRSTL